MRLGRIAILSCAAAAALSFWLRSAVPVFAVGQSPHDDLLFVRLAYSLGAGEWLGPYDDLTLIKGMAYPAFIVAAFASGIPLKLAEHATYLAAAALVCAAIYRSTRSVWVPAILFVSLAFHPVLWSAPHAQVRRESFYTALSLALLALTALSTLPRAGARSWLERKVVPVALGGVGGVFWLTREEGIWLVPALAVLVSAGALGSVRRRTPVELVSAARAFAVPVVVFAALVGAVSAMNYRQYGVFASNEFQSGAFVEAYGALSRIPHQEFRRYVVFPRDARLKAYAVSAAARELRPSLDGPTGERWRRQGCEDMRIEPCPEILGTWFAFALRDAAAEAGHHDSAPRAAAFYERLAAEINGACEDGKLTCLPARASLLPPFRLHYLADALALAPRAGRILTHPGEGGVGAPASTGPEYLLELFEDLVGPLSRPTSPFIALRGTVASREELPAVSVRDRAAAPFVAELKAVETEDRRLRFDLRTDCLRPSCELVVSAGPNERAYPIESLATGFRDESANPGLAIGIAMRRGGESGIPIVSAARSHVQLGIARALSLPYPALLPALTVVACLGILLAARLHRIVDPWNGELALALASGVAVVTRIALLAYLDVTSFTAVNTTYLSPAFPLLLVFVASGLDLGGRALVGLRKNPPQHAA